MSEPQFMQEFPPTLPMAAVDPANQPKKSGNAGKIIAVVAIVVLLVGFGGVFALLQHRGGVTNHNQQGPITGAQVLQRAAQAQLQDTSFTVDAKMASTSASGGSSASFSFTMKGDGQITRSPQREHMTVQMDMGSLGLSSTGGNTSVTIEEIIDGDNLYIKMPELSGLTNSSKPWTKETVPGGSGALGFDNSNFLDFSKMSNAKLIGEETLNGQKVWHLQVTLNDWSQADGASPSVSATATALAKSLGSTNISVTEDLWVIEANNYPAKITMHETLGSQGSGSATSGGLGSLFGQMTMDMTIQFTKWNSGATLDLPPADQVSDGFTIPTVTP